MLPVDGYSGYNVVDEVAVSCSVPRSPPPLFFEALPTAPVAQEMLDLVAELYVAEHAADGQNLEGASKLEFRKRARRANP